MTVQTQFYSFGEYCLHARDRILLRGEELVPLPPKAFDTLLVLVEKDGNLVEKDELMRQIWPDAFVEESNLANIVALLRRVLGESESKDKYIQTIPRRGYRFAASVAKRAQIGAQSAHRCCDFIEPASSVLFSELPLAASLDLFDPQPAKQATTLRSIAVLPFKSLGADRQDSLGLGIADALITRLSNLRGLLLRPTSSMLKYTMQQPDPIAIGRKLKVDAVLDGYVQLSGNRVRVTVQLVDVTADGAMIWAEKFEDEMTDLFVVQDRVSEWVAEALMLKLTAEERRRFQKRYTENSEAYQAYIKGRYFCDKRNIEGLQKSIEYFEHAIRIDPNYALAYNGLTHSYNLLGHYSFLPPAEAAAKAKAAALRGLELDDDLSEGHVSMACIKLYDEWDWRGAEASLERALELNELDPTAHQVYSHYFNTLGRFSDSTREINRAQQLDPLSLTTNTGLGLNYFFAGDYDRAIQQYLCALDIDPTYWLAHTFLAEAYSRIGRHEEAIEAMCKARDLGNAQWAHAKLGGTYVLAGRLDKAYEVLSELTDESRGEYTSPYFIAQVYGEMRDREQTIAWLRRAYQERAPWLIYMKVDPAMQWLRYDQRFQGLMRLVGFPAEALEY